MPRVKQRSAKKGSLRWIQTFVNERTDELNAAVSAAANGRIPGEIRWLSPLAEDDFSEYSDSEAMQRLTVDLRSRELATFWPRRGPQWDALALTGKREPILVEAKANIPEIITPATAAGVDSSRRIREALQEVASFLGVKSSCDWSGTFYQYANRLAHLYLLNQLNDAKAWLIFVYFIGDQDTGGPNTEAEWRAALDVMHGALGIRKHRLLNRKIDVFIDVRS